MGRVSRHGGQGGGLGFPQREFSLSLALSSSEDLTIWWENKTGGPAVATECDQDLIGESIIEGGGGPGTGLCPAGGGQGGFLGAVMFELNF